MEEPIRIISDLHLGHTASLAREIDQLEPLFRGVSTVIFNGDTVEMRSEANRRRAVTTMERVRDFCEEQDVVGYFINGNHDPIISTTNHLEVGDGSVLVTHGDVLFHEVKRPAIGPDDFHQWEELLAEEISAEALHTLESILSTNKRASPHHHVDLEQFTIPNGHWGQVSTFVRQTWPPKRLVKMVSSWRRTPQHAVDLVRRFRPETRCVIVGHTHFPGVWRQRDCTVINTGSYLPVLGRMAVDYEHGRVTVRRVYARRRRFYPGRVVARFAIEPGLRVA